MSDEPNAKTQKGLDRPQNWEAIVNGEIVRLWKTIGALAKLTQAIAETQRDGFDTLARGFEELAAIGLSAAQKRTRKAGRKPKQLK